MSNLFKFVCISFLLSLTKVSLSMEVSSGSLVTINHFKSAFVPSRPVHIWLPEGYSTSETYSVLYMHDGQMLFDSAVTWNKQDWGADEAAAVLNRSQNMKKFIIVAIENISEIRWQEYFPQKTLKDFQSKPAFTKLGIDINSLTSDNYLKFLVTELKPYVDKNYSVATDRANTFIAGSSMGGLISLYALLEYPHIFGGAACLSTHWPGRNPTSDYLLTDAILDYVTSNLPSPQVHKLYFDYGDQTLDAYYPPLQQKVDEILKKAGYQRPLWTTKFFPGHAHDENAWKSRFDQPLMFLLAK
ncbi:alpha/beta hydrolase [Aliikangiella marina]|uniref:Alpha/beta hydrolase n=1 Tax=Aliikangiella marina TaxID=1712262 RepID=A0A545T4C8_9GAMM|nr:alpha/beta hydrolase-fold protein [Aliikangiella marina]TQV72083.1 alpha/beta hydrolase [Aliikangiella marina]